MSSNRSSKLLIAAATFALVAVVLAAGIAGAVTIEAEEAPSDARVGTTVTASFMLQDLYTEYNQWTLEGSTELGNVTWTVVNRDLSEAMIGTSSYDGPSFEHSIDKGEDVATVQVEVTGRVPEVANWSYAPAHSFLLVEFRQVRQGGTSSTITALDTHHYTTDSEEARQAIDDAEEAIEDAGGNEQAENTLRNAISAYNAGNFGNAVDLAEQAEQRAVQAKQSSEQTQLLVYAGVGVIGLAVIVGGVFWYRSKQTASKL